MTSLRPVTYEDVRWEPQGRRYASTAPPRYGTYHPAVPTSIADLVLELPSSVLADAELASREIGRFDAELGGEIAPFAAVLLRSESAASSQIENLTASARAIGEAELPGGKAKRNAEVIVANTAAMQAAIALSDAVDANAILTMHRALMVNDPRHTPGEFRTEPVWIGGGSTPIGATFVGPRHELIPGAIGDLIAFAQRADIPALPQIAVSHAQFETIHPFTDGNGRTGRALVQAMLRNKDMTRQVTVPVSAGLLADTGAYFAALTSYRDGDAAPIVERFAEATVLAIGNGRRLVTDLREIRETWNDVIAARSDSAVWKVADLLTRRPVVNAALLAQELSIESTNAHRYLNPLAEAGILVETTNGPRNRVWRSPEVLAAIDAFAERAGRRG
ncbi:MULTISPECIES: Fic family protein [Mycobacterium]|uniref:Cell filamentation protein Fic n=1 Tax=Mycobacterium syngnathidarum TaxID=1908205 RepID=A0A1S1KP13_9MYCO|nr:MULTISPECIES: Fic family protein [Mycobacterium]MCG7606245.1 Fic family protein [Mycobacterium sp. CnD-18-1]OHU08140.1 cell filamentation protein Fic [Mycobacterium syngnathidarum]OLT90249.1 cell filamentation protein Fic [Mycobacterium syngnathidarum]TMS52252.1 Fic family protein [Mycobacterium sp. DBP42]